MWLRSDTCNCGLERLFLYVCGDHCETEVQQFGGHVTWRELEQTRCETLQHRLGCECRNIGEHLAVLRLVVQLNGHYIDLGRTGDGGYRVSNLDPEASNGLTGDQPPSLVTFVVGVEQLAGLNVYDRRFDENLVAVCRSLAKGEASAW